jgi:hypothetical protein
VAEYGPAEFGKKHGRPWVKQSEIDPAKGTEYGGVEGLIQPYPHDIKTEAREQLMLLMNTDPGDELSGIELPPLKTVRKYTD